MFLKYKENKKRSKGVYSFPHNEAKICIFCFSDHNLSNPNWIEYQTKLCIDQYPITDSLQDHLIEENIFVSV